MYAIASKQAVSVSLRTSLAMCPGCGTAAITDTTNVYKRLSGDNDLHSGCFSESPMPIKCAHDRRHDVLSVCSFREVDLEDPNLGGRRGADRSYTKAMLPARK